MKDEGVKKEKTQWDKRKIFLFSLLCLFLLFAGFEIKSFILDKNINYPQKQDSIVSENVKGVSTINSSTDGIKNTIQENINALKKQASDINVTEIATSSPQVQKLINDLKALQNYPQSGLKDACFKICNGI